MRILSDHQRVWQLDLEFQSSAGIPTGAMWGVHDVLPTWFGRGGDALHGGSTVGALGLCELRLGLLLQFPLLRIEMHRLGR